ncbi:MAG: hypothetical protein KAT05_08100 [Spirochaetes bacterium]|nr:hypothetical protein [Spirochaetota bacterium]
MKKNKISFSRLVSELKSDINIMEELYEKYKMINKKIGHINPDEFDWASLGYTIHNLYNLLENYFLRISKFFENDLPTLSWHKELVDRMTIEIDDVRPALFDRKLEKEISELRAFRHIFRNIYQSELDTDKLKGISKKIPEIIERFKQCHDDFVVKLEKIKSAI